MYFNGGEAVEYTASFSENEEIILPTNSTKQYYHFDGWYKDENLTIGPYEKIQVGTTSDQVFYAKWESHSPDEFAAYMLEFFEYDVEEDINLPTTYGGLIITWISNDPNVISNNGLYNRPYLAKVISLTATVTSLNGTVYQVYDVMVKGYKTLSTGIASSYIYRNYSTVTDEFFEILDIVNCAFIIANSNGSLTGTTFLNNVQNYIIPKAHNNGVWVIMSIAPESSWSTIAASPTLINTFADNIVNIINSYGFDGVDIDWEFPSSSEKTNFTNMMAVIYNKVKDNNPDHLVTAAISGGMWQPPNYDLVNSQQYIDYINMMTYSMVSNSGYYQNALYNRSTYAHSTFSVGRTLTSCSIVESVAFFKNNYNIPNSKIIVGVSFYGVRQTRTYDPSTSTWSTWGSGGTIYYHNIVSNYLNNSNYTYFYDEISQVPYIVKNDGTEFISYDNRRSIEAKSAYVLSLGLGGIMYWENGCDNTGELLDAIKVGLNK